ncbi:MAG: hypothetical protein GXY83_42030 [Rhodopirellula sp.]|nr:hypothetical protein [Rhodopirellula sp.]
MHALFTKASGITRDVIGAAIEIHKLLSYMKLLDIPLGLVISFHALKLTEGVARLILPGANLE